MSEEINNFANNRNDDGNQVDDENEHILSQFDSELVDIDGLRRTQVIPIHHPDHRDYNHVDFVNNAGIEVSGEERKLRGVKAIGVVIYGDRGIYSDDIEEIEVNLSRHIGISGKYIPYLLKKHFDSLGCKVKQIVVGHEHGGRLKKCHYQCVVLLKETINLNFKPFKIVVGRNILLGMGQKARNNYALVKYCQKDGDVYKLYDEASAYSDIDVVYKKDNNGNDTTKVDVWATVVRNKSVLSKEELHEFVMKYSSEKGVNNYRNIEYCLERITKPSLPPFEWQPLPSHIEEKYPLIGEWYNRWCKIEGLDRRKALLLYSKERSMGKTRFVQSLVNDLDYIVTFRNTFTQSSLQNKVPKLLLLDDMGCYDDKNKETWKALVASQVTSIRDAYTNFVFPYQIPTIITTNNFNLVSNLYLSDEFKTQIYFICIDSYMGPDGTQPTEFMTTVHNFSHGVMTLFDNKRKERENFINNKKNIFGVDKHDEIEKLKMEKHDQRLLFEMAVHKYETQITAMGDFISENSKLLKENSELKVLVESNVKDNKLLFEENESFKLTNNNLVDANLALMNQVEELKLKITFLEEENEEMVRNFRSQLLSKKRRMPRIRMRGGKQ
jgi:hypothetical protein